ncbi:MAG TPA: Asp-tRNA(Asn)/Glu-tRNA(Gln) amidotransferase subunit GatC [Fimbriimonadaceae bacterium]|nr:Asp-tRNA(Asn)/Glu-tRNA(Gln) amidotransferase subunit GatC [Fimbriimonadaceae bacterium]
MSISLDEVRHVARLARLDLDDSEILALQGELNALIGHFSDIDALDGLELEATSHPIPLQNVWAADVPEAGLRRDDTLQNAPLTKAGLFVVPNVLEG